MAHTSCAMGLNSNHCCTLRTRISRVLPIKEHTVFASRDISLQFPNITAGIDGMNNRHRPTVFRFELENNSKQFGLRSEEMRARSLHAKTMTPAVELKRLQNFKDVSGKWCGTTPPNKVVATNLNTMCTETLLFPQGSHFCQEFLEDRSAHKEELL